MLQFEGVIAIIGESQQVTEKFTKREVWLRTDSDQYPQTVNFQLSQDRCDLIDNFSTGQSVKVNFNLRGRTWTGQDGVEKCFNTLEIWKIESMQQPEAIPPVPSAVAPDGDDDDLPF